MNKVTEGLYQNRMAVQQLEAPEDMEERLRSALSNAAVNAEESDEKSWKGKHNRWFANNRRTRQIGNNTDRWQFLKRRNWQVQIAVMIALVILFAYQSDTIAYYAKRFIGYDQVMNMTLNELNNMGEGQPVGKSYTFQNGVILTLDGIMLDDNQLLAFYTMTYPGGNVQDLGFFENSFKGLATKYYLHSAMGEISEDKHETHNIAKYDAPSFWEKNLNWQFAFFMEQGVSESGMISFTLDRNKAMGHTLKKTLNQEVQVDESTIRFESIQASPTVTVIKGSIQSLLDLATDYLMGERFYPYALRLRLLADGKALQNQGYEISTGMSGITFELESDALPTDVQKLQIEVVSLASVHDVYQTVELSIGEPNVALNLLGQTVTIDRVAQSAGATEITISSEESVTLGKVDLIADGQRISLEETNTDQYTKSPEGVVNHTRTLRFPGTGQTLQLDIQRMTYEKTYNLILDVPLD